MAIYVGYTAKRRTIRIVTAGDTQYLLCPPSDIEMLAVLSDMTNTRNHTFFWEQLSGPPVILASTDTLGTSFPFADTEDKKFRFWLDYGTNKAQYKDIDIFYTPTSVMQPRVMNSKQFYQHMTVPNLAQQDTFVFDEPTGTLNGNVDKIPAVSLSWDPIEPLLTLNKSVKFEILTDSGFKVDPEEVYASFDFAAGEYVYEIPLPNGVYRFRFYYDFGAMEPTVYDSPYIVLKSRANTDDAWGIDDVHDIGKQACGQNLDLVRFTIKRQSVDSVHNTNHGLRAGLIGADNNIWSPGDPPPVGQTIIPRRVDSADYPDLEWSHPLYNGATHNLINLTRLDPSNIGS